MRSLVDTTEVYLRAVLELEEERVPALRARVAERVRQSLPVVSQTVARLVRAGLLTTTADRCLVLTEHGRARAVVVMRRHRLAELLLVRVIGLSFLDAHTEACRWQHVLGTAVERHIYELLGRPTRCPYGNPIPGLHGLVPRPPEPVREVAEQSLSCPDVAGVVTVSRICEGLQAETATLRQLYAAGVEPGSRVVVAQERGTVLVGLGDESVRLPHKLARQVFVLCASPGS